jgi:hypothetical protein
MAQSFGHVGWKINRIMTPRLLMKLPSSGATIQKRKQKVLPSCLMADKAYATQFLLTCRTQPLGQAPRGFVPYVY